MSAASTVAFKIVGADEWAAVGADGAYAGSAVDLADGYIHMSSADQWRETARRHYAGRTNLLLLTVDLSGFGDVLRWEASRGGALFPHLYAPLPASAVTSVRAFDMDADGAPVFADGGPA